MKERIKIKAPPLHVWQKQVIQVFDEHPNNSIITIKSPRQRGKTHTLLILSMRQCINNEDFTTIIICPTYSICRKQYHDFEKAIKNIPIIKSANSSYFEIELTNGSIIKFKSAESKQNLRGETANLVIIDEASFVDMQTALECFNYVNTTNGNIVIASTPTFEDDSNLFYKYYKAAKDGEKGCYLIDFCDYDTTEMLSEERIEMYKKTLPHNIYLNEIMGEFLSTKSSLWDFGSVLRNNVLADNDMVCGIDFASGVNNDETAIAIFNSQKQMCNILHFNDKDATETIEFIVNVLIENNIRKCVVETNSMGRTYIDFLRKEISRKNINTQIIEFATTNGSKRRIIQNLQLNIANKTITLLDEQQLKIEFAQFEMKQTPSGLITYGNSSDNIHDDIVLATAFALEAFNKRGAICVR